MFKHIKSYDNQDFLYNTECNMVFEYNDFLYNIFSNDEPDKSELQFSYPDVDVDKQIDTLASLKNQYQEIKTHKKSSAMEDKGYHTLWLNIAHDCNLNCIYCYGEGGSYNKQTKLINFDMAKKIIDYWIEKIDKTAEELSVIFFGGEPLLNKEVMINCVSYINSILGDKFVLKYGTTTNVTLIDDEILNLFQNNYFNVTLSIDGGEETQNRNRPYKNGKGSYTIVRKNLEQLRNITPVLTARMTLIRSDVDKAIDRVEELWNLGVNNIAFEMVETSQRELAITVEDMPNLEKQIELLGKRTYENIIHGDSKIIVEFIKNGRTLQNHLLNICSFYDNKTLKVDPEGEVFRCHRLIGKNEFSTGNLFMVNETEKNNEEEILPKKCEVCWAKNICVRCPETNLINTGDINKPNTTSCRFKKKMILESLKLYVSLYKGDKALFKKMYS